MESDVDLFVRDRNHYRLLLIEVFILVQRYLPLYTTFDLHPPKKSHTSFGSRRFVSSRSERFTISGYGTQEVHTGLGVVNFASDQPGHVRPTSAPRSTYI